MQSWIETVWNINSPSWHRISYAITKSTSWLDPLTVKKISIKKMVNGLYPVFDIAPNSIYIHSEWTDSWEVFTRSWAEVARYIEDDDDEDEFEYDIDDWMICLSDDFEELKEALSFAETCLAIEDAMEGV